MVKSQKNDVLICGCTYDIIKKRKEREREDARYRLAVRKKY